MGLFSRRRLFLLASYRMVLAGERKSPNRIAREIEIFGAHVAQWVGLGPEAELEVLSFPPLHNLLIMMIN